MSAKFRIGDTLVTGRVPDNKTLSQTNTLIMTHDKTGEEWRVPKDLLVEYVPVSETAKKYYEAIVDTTVQVNTSESSSTRTGSSAQAYSNVRQDPRH